VIREKILVVWAHILPQDYSQNQLEKKIIQKIIKPTLRALKDKKKKFKGFLYAGSYD
jgi:phosphoribosylamine-glycine ligase